MSWAINPVNEYSREAPIILVVAKQLGPGMVNLKAAHGQTPPRRQSR